MKYAGLYLATLSTYERRKEPDRPGWQPTLPTEPGIVHAIRRYGAIATISEPIYLEGPYEYQRAMCGAKVKVLLPTAFATAKEDACLRCKETGRKEKRQGPPEPTPWFGYPWWKPAPSFTSIVVTPPPDRLNWSHSA
jgi:hypothetical protein